MRKLIFATLAALTLALGIAAADPASAAGNGCRGFFGKSYCDGI